MRQEEPVAQQEQHKRRKRMASLAVFAAILILLVSGLALGASWFEPLHQLGLLRPDRSAPVVAFTAPAADLATRDPLIAISARADEPVRFLELLSGLDLSTLVFSVNGEPRTEGLSIKKRGLGAYLPWLPLTGITLVYKPVAPARLPEGVVTAAVTIKDRAGNASASELRFVVDSHAPVITALAPAEGATLPATLVPLTFAIAETGSGLEPASLAVKVNGAPKPSGNELTGERLSILPPAEGWAEGPLNVELILADKVGNVATASFAYTVQPRVELAAYPRAVPASGDAPLTVTLIPDATTTTAIERYEWDFQGDGTFDRSETVGRNQSFIYTVPGIYDVVLRVTDTASKQATGTVRVVVGNRPPLVEAEAAPSNGAPPLAVTFTARATDSDGIASYEWDFQGDGTYDASGPLASASFTYAAEGVFKPRLRVTDTKGAATELAVPSIEVRVTAGAPSVTATASPTSGNVPLTVNFSATATDPNGHAITEWAWDFQGDGTYERSSSTSPATTFRYSAPGIYYARVRATAADDGTGVDVIRLEVKAVLSLRVSADTMDASLNEKTLIETTLGGDTAVSVVIEDRGGALVRTLVPFTLRPAGQYSDEWDGRDAAGAVASEGEYRAVLLYRADSETRRYDLGLTTGGVQSNPPRSTLPNRFAPLAGQPLSITYTLSRASEVTAFMGRYNVNARLITFLQREARGRGSHTLVWNGENSEGQLIHPPPGDEFLFGIFAYTLPDNAIYVRGAVHPSALVVTPSIFDPTGLAGDGLPLLSRTQFSLNRAGKAELSVYNADSGAQVYRRTTHLLDAGAQILDWDGRTNEGVLVAPGRYRLGVVGLDERGGRSPSLYALQRVYY